MKVSECDGVILCGGQGKRLRSVVSDVPKVMAEVNGRPFLDHILDYLKAQDISRVILCTGYKADVIEEYYRARDCGVSIKFSREHEPLGTGGALRNARNFIYSNPFLVLNGDSFIPVSLQPFLDFHLRVRAEASMIVSQVNEHGDFGSLKLDDDQRIIDFREKSPGNGMHVVNAGIYCFSQKIFSKMPQDKISSLENDYFPKLAGGEFFGFITDKVFMDIGTPDRYNFAKHNLKRGNRGED